jgi:hypothetical protein
VDERPLGTWEHERHSSETDCRRCSTLRYRTGKMRILSQVPPEALALTARLSGGSVAGQESAFSGPHWSITSISRCHKASNDVQGRPHWGGIDSLVWGTRMRLFFQVRIGYTDRW